MMYIMDDKGILIVNSICIFKLMIELFYFIEVRNGKRFG